MKTKTKALLLALCAILLVVASVFGTMAFLTDTQTVENTFTVGQVHIKLDEAKVNAEGKPLNTSGAVVDDLANAARVSTAKGVATPAGNAYHLLPGQEYTKDPTVTVVGGSEDAYVRIIVTVNNISGVKAASISLRSSGSATPAMFKRLGRISCSLQVNKSRVSIYSPVSRSNAAPRCFSVISCSSMGYVTTVRKYMSRSDDADGEMSCPT